MSDEVRAACVPTERAGKTGASAMQRVLPENVILNIQENSGQITIGNYVMQLGSGYGALVHSALRRADTSLRGGGIEGGWSVRPGQKPQIQPQPTTRPELRSTGNDTTSGVRLPPF